MFPEHLTLTGFTWPELLILTHHLQYAAARLEQELLRLRRGQPHFFPAHSGSRAVTLAQWAGLKRDFRYFSGLARAVETVLDAAGGLLFLPDGCPPALDLSGLLARDRTPFLRFLERERHRTRLAAAYVQAQPFDVQVRQDLLHALDIELRFFNRLLDRLGPVTPPVPAGPSPGEAERVTLLFVSLPKPLVTTK